MDTKIYVAQTIQFIEMNHKEIVRATKIVRCAIHWTVCPTMRDTPFLTWDGEKFIIDIPYTNDRLTLFAKTLSDAYNMLRTFYKENENVKH